MKNNARFGWLVVLLGCLMTEAVLGQVVSLNLVTFTNLPPSVYQAKSSNVMSSVTLRQGTGISIWTKWTRVAPSGDLTLLMSLTPDGTNYCDPFPVVMIGGGSGAKVSWTNLPAYITDGSVGLRLNQISNSTAASVIPTDITCAMRN